MAWAAAEGLVTMMKTLMINETSDFFTKINSINKKIGSNNATCKRTGRNAQ